MLKDIRSGDKAKDILKGQNPVQIFSVKGKDRTTLEGKTLSVKKICGARSFSVIPVDIGTGSILFLPQFSFSFT